jgi:hypothetical protein
MGGGAATEPPGLPRFDRPQHLGLRGEAEFGDLIEKRVFMDCEVP